MPVATTFQNSRCTSFRCDGWPGDFIADRPVNVVIQPAGLPINTSIIEVLRRPVEFTQYTAIRYGQRLVEAGAFPSVGSKGDSFDNAAAESTIGLYKTELIYEQQTWRNEVHIEMETLQYVEWFNNERIHGTCADMSPLQFEARFKAAS